jgi:hypothetical protein
VGGCEERAIANGLVPPASHIHASPHDAIFISTEMLKINISTTNSTILNVSQEALINKELSEVEDIV